MWAKDETIKEILIRRDRMTADEADELIEDGLMTQDEVDRLMRGIIQIIENGEIDDGETKH